MILTKLADPFYPVTLVHDLIAVGYLSSMPRVIAAIDRNSHDPVIKFEQSLTIHFSCPREQ